MDNKTIMRHIGKNLYLLSENNYIHVDNDDILITNENGQNTRIPPSLIENIVVFGNNTISSFLLRFCSKHNIGLSYVSEYGKLYGRFSGEFNRCIVLRKKQYDLYQTNKSFSFSKSIILAKAVNSKNNLLQCVKDATDENKKDALIVAANTISSFKEMLLNCQTDEELLGIEGKISQIYFSHFDSMLKTKDEKMLFIERSRRPPENFCNCLLSFLYTLYTNDITSALESAGLDSYLGYNHKLHPGRQSLSLDVLEEFRAVIIDRFVITIINRKQITPKDFSNKEHVISLSEEGRKKLLKLWEDYKETKIKHSLYNKEVEIKLLPYLQEQLLAQFIRGDIDEYPPFVKG